MKAVNYCYECLSRLAQQAAELSTHDELTRSTALDQSLKILKDNFSTDRVSIVIATKMHDAIKKVSGNSDPYRSMKDKEIEIGRKLSRDLVIDKHDFMACLKFSALGNSLDFFRPLEVILNDMKQAVNFVIDDTHRFEALANHAPRMLFLADNAGEAFFDLPLLRWLRRRSSVAYVVKSAPVQNDITLADIKLAGLDAELGEILSTGTATPGIDFTQASPEFIREFSSADLILAKGMGYYETLSEFPAEGKIFYCLRAKCQPVADSLHVPLNSYVATLR